MAQQCVALYPHSTVTIYDLPKVVRVAKEQFVSPEEHQITFHEGRHGQRCGGVVVSQLFLQSPALLRDVILEAPAAPYGHSIPGCTVPKPGLQLSQLSISSCHRHNSVIQ